MTEQRTGRGSKNRPIIPLDKNPSTHVGLLPDESQPSDAFFRVAFGLVAEKIAEISSPESRGVVAAVVTPRTGETDASYVKLEDDCIETLVMGRHACADLVLRNDHALSLRHAMVLVKLGHDRKPLVRVLDLRSGAGLKDMQGRPHLSIAANRPVCLRASESALFVMPSNLYLISELTRNPYSVFEKVAWMDPEPWIPRVDPEQHLLDLSLTKRETSVVSVVTHIKDVAKQSSSEAEEPRAGMIQLDTGAKSYTHEVDTISLRAGVLVGRYGRCAIGSEAKDLPDVVSRVHALLLSIDEQIHIFDVGSTHGLTLDNLPIRNLVLSTKAKSTFDIDEDVKISWVPGPPTSTRPPRRK